MRTRGVSAANVFHLAWARVVATLSGRDDVVFGTVLVRMNSGAGADRVPGLFVNTLPVRVRIGAASVGEALTGMRHQLTELLVHEHAPLSLAQQASGIAAGSPLFTSLFNYRPNQSSAAPDPAGRADLRVRMLSLRETTNFRWWRPSRTAAPPSCWASTRWIRSTGRRCGRLLHTCLGNLVTALEEDPDLPLRMIEVLDKAERDRLVHARNDTSADVPAATLPQLIEAQAARTPAGRRSWRKTPR